ncbi:hypothetical protein BJV82DRAFT_628954 [Fennellomyces sp. T-0311]|nr:hypothetical protein BJV82DRAFT_628954 [Fennellomyces sp. T-0311]
MAQVSPSPMTYTVNGMDGYIFPGTATIETDQQSITLFFFSRHCSPYPLQLMCPIELTMHLDVNWQDRSVWRYVLIDGSGEFKWHREGPRTGPQIQVNVHSILELPDRSQHYLPRHILDWALIWLPDEIRVPIEESVNDSENANLCRNIERLVLGFRHYRTFSTTTSVAVQDEQSTTLVDTPMSSLDDLSSFFSSEMSSVDGLSAVSRDGLDESLDALDRMYAELQGMRVSLAQLRSTRQ